jgi:hypothetical protein
VSASPKVLKGRFVNLFDSELALQRRIVLEPGKRVFLLDLDAGEIFEAAICSLPRVKRS